MSKHGPLESDHHLYDLDLEEKGVLRAEQDTQRRSVRGYLRRGGRLKLSSNNTYERTTALLRRKTTIAVMVVMGVTAVLKPFYLGYPNEIRVDPSRKEGKNSAEVIAKAR